jgi:hypothetical protein
MKYKQKGFSAVEVLVIVVVVAVLGFVGWRVYDSQQSKTENSQAEATPKTEMSDDEPTVSEPEDTSSNFTYSVPSGWKNVDHWSEPYKTGTGNILISPDYKEGGTGQLSIVSGAFINFYEIGPNTVNPATLEEAMDMYKNDDSGGYLDRDSVKITEAGGKQVIMYDSGHTTDAVTVTYISADDAWLEVSFNVGSGENSDNDAQSSPYYQTFLTWLDEFVSQN